MAVSTIGLVISTAVAKEIVVVAEDFSLAVAILKSLKWAVPSFAIMAVQIRFRYHQDVRLNRKQNCLVRQ